MYVYRRACRHVHVSHFVQGVGLGKETRDATAVHVLSENIDLTYDQNTRNGNKCNSGGLKKSLR